MLGEEKSPCLGIDNENPPAAFAFGPPPPLNRGEIPPGFLQSISHLDLEDEGVVWDTLWTYYKTTTPRWMAQASRLPLRPPVPPGANLNQNSLLTPSP